jgi:hypothetical protein
MARFNLDDYETVEARLARFHKDHPNGRVITENLTTLQDRQVSTWVFKATIYFDGEAEARATGHAFEIDGGSGANLTSAMENAETSAIGRALANCGYSGNKRTTREEMAKVNRGNTPNKPSATNTADLVALAKQSFIDGGLDALRGVYAQAKFSGVDQQTLRDIEALAKEKPEPATQN